MFWREDKGLPSVARVMMVKLVGLVNGAGVQDISKVPFSCPQVSAGNGPQGVSSCVLSGILLSTRWSGGPGQQSGAAIRVDLRLSTVVGLTESMLGKSGKAFQKNRSSGLNTFCSLLVWFSLPSDLRRGLLLHWISERCVGAHEPVVMSQGCGE